MKKQNLAEIAQASGKSLSTVSKVLRGCGGVSTETRNAVLNEVDGLELISPSQESLNHAISVILPDNPKYFWHQAYDALKASDIQANLKLFSAIRTQQDEEIVERYIEEEVLSGCRALILSSFLNERLCQRLAELARHMLIIQLCEYYPISNSFFVGSDGEKDGMRLAAMLPKETNRPLNIGILMKKASNTGEKRWEGIRKTLPENAHVFFIQSPEFSKLYSSHLARSIDALNIPLDYLFCLDGITALACEALYKLKSHMDTKLLGFEYPPTAKKYMESGLISSLVLQKPKEQMRTALSLAGQYARFGCYPETKFTFLPSELICNTEEKKL